MDVDSEQYDNIIKRAVPRSLATRALDYSYGPPSPPHIQMPYTFTAEQQALPAYAGVGGEELSEPDLKIITQVGHIVVQNSSQWKYESRRQAQMITPFLYLGPSSAAKDRDFICREGITMLLAARDTKSAQASLLSGEKVANELSIASAAVDTAGNQELIAAFPAAVKIINDHLLAVYKGQTVHRPSESGGGVTINANTFQRGKVLVFCESGNERSAAVVIAYLLAIFGFDFKGAVTFVQAQRFCVALDDSMIRVLESFSDIVRARRQVAYQRKEVTVATISNQLQLNARTRKAKRHIDDTMDEDDGDELDVGRFQDRIAARPFIDDCIQRD